MNKGEGYLSPGDIKFRRRYTDIDAPGFGKLHVRNTNGREHCRIKAVVQQTAAAKSEEDAAAAFVAELTEWWIQCVVDPATKEPLYTDRDRPEIAEFDSGLLELVAQGCATHCDLPQLSGTVKN